MGFVSCVSSGAFRAVLSPSGLGCASWPATCSGGLFGLVSCPVMSARRAAHSSRPAWVVLTLPSVVVLAGAELRCGYGATPHPWGLLGQWQTSRGCHRFLRWRHPGAVIESSLAFCTSGLKPSLQRLWCIGTRLLAGCGFGRTGSQRQVGTTVVCYGMSELHFDLAKAGSVFLTNWRGMRAWATEGWCPITGSR